MLKFILTSYTILSLMGILSGGVLIIPFTATLTPAIERTMDPEVTDTATPVSLQSFIRSVFNGDGEAVVGIFVPGVLALPVSQQPPNQAAYVTREPDQTTQFKMAEQYGTVGILAHNDLAGSQFPGIKLNQYAIVVFGDGHVDYYVIREVQKYKALSSTSPTSDFVNVNNEHERLSAGQLFNRIYSPGDRLVFQTCIASENDPSWGRLFIIATPLTRQVRTVVEQTTHLMELASFGMISN